MRRLVLAALMVGVAHGALAADLPDLPVLRGFVGEPSHAVRTSWEGFYVGGQGAIGTSDMDFTGATSGLTAQLLAGTQMEIQQNVSGWQILGKGSNRGTGFGGFVGYNAQWDEAVIGVEASLLQGHFGGSQSGAARQFFVTSNGYTNDVTNSGFASIRVRDEGTLRVRGGWAWSCFMPYLFAGVATGIADFTQTTRVSGDAVSINALPGFQIIPFDLNANATQNGRFVYGYSAGAGMDVMLLGGLFARGELEYVKFVGAANMSITTVRGGVGYKF